MSRTQLSLATSAPFAREETAPEALQDVLGVLAGRLPQLRAERAAAHAALSAIDDAPRDVRRVNPGAEKRAAERHLENCQAREAASFYARDFLALRAVFSAAAPAIDTRILERGEAVDRARAQLHDAAAAASGLRSRYDALCVQPEALGSRQGEIDAAKARLASASDAGDDAGAEAAAREITRVRREQVETIDPLDLRIGAAQDALTRAEAQQARIDEQLAAAVKALHDAELDKLKLARDEAAMNLRDRDIELAAAGYWNSAWPRSTQYSVGLTPELLKHLGGERQGVTGSFIEARAKERRAALEPDRSQA